MMKRVLIALGVMLSVPGVALATTELSWQAPSELGPGVFGQLVLVARPDAAINAVSGTIVYDPARLEVVSVADADSVVRHWIVPPVVRNGMVEFAGIIPGGVGPGFGDALALLTLTVRGVQEGRAEVALLDADVRLNQPDGRADGVSVRPLTIVVREGASAPAIASADPAVTEAFLQVVSESDIRDGAPSLIFDIRGGFGSLPVVVLHERFLGLPDAGREVVSPARLEDQHRLSILEVRTLEGDVIGRMVPWRVWVVWAVLLIVAVLLLCRRFKRN